MSVDFESGTPIWSVVVEHNTPDTDGFWFRTFNAEDQREAIDLTQAFFAEDGLPLARITRIWIEELKPLKEGD